MIQNIQYAHHPYKHRCSSIGEGQELDETLTRSAYWDDDREGMYEWLEAQDAKSLAELYQGCADLLYGIPLPGWPRMVAHAVREIANSLPEIILGGEEVVSRFQWRHRLNHLTEIWGLGERLGDELTADISDGVTPPDKPPDRVAVPIEAVEATIDVLEEHIEKNTNNADKARLMFAKIGENENFEGVIEPMIRRWVEVTNWFRERVHDPRDGRSDTDYSLDEYRSQFRSFEKQLLPMAQAFSENLEDIDELLERANTRTD